MNLREQMVLELAPHIEWDPSTEEYKPYDHASIRHVFKRHFKEEGYEKAFEEAGGDTLYKVLKNHPLCNLLHYIMGKASVEDLLDATKKGITEGLDRYPIIVTNGEEFVKSLQEISQEIWSVRASGVLGFDMSKVKLELPDFKTTVEINEKLKDKTTLPPLQMMVESLLTQEENQETQVKLRKEAEELAEVLKKDIERLQEEVSKAQMSFSGILEVQEDEILGIPEGKAEFKKASEVFDVELLKDIEVPVWEWDGVHPDVPKVDPDYIFRPDLLLRVLYSIVSNKRMYLQGHTGTGKTTLIEQVCAHLKYPFIRTNFDSEITRMDLIGRDTLTEKDGKTVSTFVEGILPRAMASPCIFCADEIDFVRPDVAYVMQSALEGNGLRITEDGDRFVKPHPFFRMVATGNTVGQGDEHGMYQGARPQSLALLDRFTVWAQVDYLDKDKREDLVKNHHPALSLDNQKALSKYMDEHIEAFVNGKVLQPISPRGMLAIAQAATVFDDLGEALRMVVLDRSSNDDRAVLKGIIDRIV